MQIDFNILEKKTNKDKISITLDHDLNMFLEDIADKNNSTKSKVLQYLIRSSYNKEERENNNQENSLINFCSKQKANKTKAISVTINENTLNRIHSILDYYQSEGFNVSRSSFIESALQSYINSLESNNKEIRKCGGIS
jgi:metal-responsive CopG/Arc/MetJ family transcriptional regulator